MLTKTTYFGKRTIFAKIKNFNEENGMSFTILQTSLMLGFTEDS